MKKNNENSTSTLTRLSLGSRLVSEDLEEGQNALRLRLRSAILHSHQMKSRHVERSPFRSAWLPGPLSYPWLLMFVSVPRIIEHLLNHS